MKLVIFEDQLTDQLKPFSINHAVFEIKTGLFSNLERFENYFLDYEIYLVVRDSIREVVQHRYPQYSVNPEKIPLAKCINAKIVWDNNYIDFFSQESMFFFKNKSSLSLSDFKKKINSFESNKIPNDSINHINFLWDSIYLFNTKISQDFLSIQNNSIESIENVSFINPDSVIINKNAKIKSGVVIDASNGPVCISSNTVIDIGSLIQGPVFIDKGSYISPGSKIRGGTLIGPDCKIGGEVTNSIFHGKSNKVHDGFIGHSYIGEWVNIGAGTNNSNLKNNYSNVKFDLGKKIIDSERIFLGTMIGDFSRIAISTSLNTGTFIGIGSNVFNHDFNKKFINSFSWGNSEKVDFNKFIETCKRMLKRRDIKMHDSEKNLLKYLYQNI